MQRGRRRTSQNSRGRGRIVEPGRHHHPPSAQTFFERRVHRRETRVHRHPAADVPEEADGGQQQRARVGDHRTSQGQIQIKRTATAASNEI